MSNLHQVETIPELMETNCLTKLVELLNVNSPTIKEYAAATIWNCARLDTVKTQFRNNRGLPILLSLLYETSENVLENITGALSLLTVDLEIRDKIFEALGPLFNLLDTSNNEYILENILTIIKNYTSESKFQHIELIVYSILNKK